MNGAPTAGSLNGIQRHLERIYELDTAHDVDHFLITDRRLAQVLGSGTDARDSGETLLVHEHENDLDIALYLDAGIMEVLGENDPLESLNDDNLAEFWTALEGVSHFLYLVWNADHGRSISRFEMELQAEVDKFAAAVFLLGGQGGARVPRRLHERLFAAPVFDPLLRGAELRRYRNANHYAALYCTRLQRECMEDRRFSMVRELRRFYRLTHRHKLQHIARS